MVDSLVKSIPHQDREIALCIGGDASAHCVFAACVYLRELDSSPYDASIVRFQLAGELKDLRM